MAGSISTDKLSKAYGRSSALALDNLSIDIQSGEIYGFLGANGAGKSTTIRLLLNFLQPTSGTASILGLNVVTDSVAARRYVGYLSGDVALYPKVTGDDLLHYLLDLQGYRDTSYLKQLITNFEADVTKPIGSLSKGNRQKIGVIQSLMHRPEVLILDEPTSGLDPLMQEVFYDALRTARDRGAAVLMSSHNLDEAQRVCDRVGIIKHGKLIREQAIQDNDLLTIPVFRVSFRSPAAVKAVQHTKQLRFHKQLDDTTVLVQPAHDIAEGLAALSKFDISGFKSEQTTLEDEFLGYYGDKPV